VKLKGKVEYRDLEGGTYELAAEDGRRYTLVGAKAELKAAKGAQVEVEGSLDEGFGISMSGPQLKVARVRKL
jgi:formylmethanofuran dehydrogenase subunit C